MWEMIFALALPALFSATLAGSFVLANRQRLRFWQKIAVSCGLQVEEISSTRAWHSWLKARAGPLEVRLVAPLRRDYSCWIVIVAPGPPGFSGVRIRSESTRLGRHEIEIGDDPFDAAFYVLGPMRLLFALLDMETRRLLMSVNAESETLEIVGGELRVKTYNNQIDLLLPLLLDIGRRFAQPLDAAQRLAENARQDPDIEVRLRNLLLLIREFPAEPATLEVLRTACADKSPRIRLRAAKELGAEGREVLLEMAEATADDLLSAEAVSLLGRDLPVERTRAILLQALRKRLHRTACACLDTLGHSTAAEDVETLVKVLTREKSELAAAAATALGSTGSPAAEPPLILALQAEHQDLQVAAANALARVGSTAAVLPLKELAEHTSHHPEIRKAARQAIAEIQSRLSGASPGQLSLAGVEAGQLSLAQTEAGQLSLTTVPAGQLSLGGEEKD